MKRKSFNNQSEIIAKIIIEKIITNVLIDNYVKSLENKKGFFCFDYIKQTLSPFFEEYFISTDSGNNVNDTWVEIPEPVTQEKDRGAFALAKMQKQEDQDKEGQIHEINELQSFTQHFPLKLSSNIIKKEPLSKLDQDLPQPKAEKKEKNRINELISSFPSYEINSFHIPNEPDFIEQVRQDYQKELIHRNIIKQKEKSRLSLIKSNSTGDIVSPLNNGKGNKEFNNDRYTFDSNGKVIPYRFIRLETFKKDFKSPEVVEKVVKNTIEKLNDNQKTEKIIKNRTKLIESLPQEIKSHRNIYKIVLNSLKGRNSISNSRCPPSGDNFSLFQPEVGVVIKNPILNQTKDGGMNFSEKFNRFSLNDYSQLVKTVIPYQNKIKSHSQTKRIEGDLNTSNPFINCNSIQSKISSYNILSNTLEPKMVSKLSHSSSMTTMKVNANIKTNLKLFLDSIDSFPDTNNLLLSTKKSYIISKNNSCRDSNDSTSLFSNANYLNKMKTLKKRDMKRKELNQLNQINMFNSNLISQKKKWGSATNATFNNLVTPKIPSKPNFFKIIKKNGINVKPSLPFRVNYVKKVE